MPGERPNLFEFLDYRAYLRSYYEFEKRRRPAFSFRFFAKEAGFKSPNFLKLVIDGERNLGPDSVPRFARALKLDAEECLFFSDLVAFNQASSAEQASRAIERVMLCRRFRAVRKIDGGLFEYLSHWYYPAIRELAGRPDFNEDPQWVARQLLPHISVLEARNGLKLLIELGLLVRDASGKLKRGEPSLSTGHEVQSIAVLNYHKQMLERARTAMELVGRERRDVSALTICISDATVQELKERIHRFRDELLERCDLDRTPDAVYQLNIQLFPLSVEPDRASQETPK